MKYQTVSTDDSPSPASCAGPFSWRDAGLELSRSHPAPQRRGCARGEPDRRPMLRGLMARAAAVPGTENAEWLLDNPRLIFGAEKTAREFYGTLATLPVVCDSSGVETARVCLVARGYLEACGYCFREPEFTAFLDGYQETRPLEMDEVWGLQTALQMGLLDHLVEAAPADWPVLLTSIRTVGDTPWRYLFETVNRVHTVLARDPAGAYSRMDFDSRMQYLNVVADLAAHSARTESEIAEAVLGLCQQACAASDGSRAALRCTHVGFYLVDRGRSFLESRIGYRPPLRARIPRLILQHPGSFYLAGIELLTLAIVFGILIRLDLGLSVYAALLLLILPATQAATDFINTLATSLVPPRTVPKLDFSEGIPDDCICMVAVPTLLLDEGQVRDLVLDLEIRFLANRDPNLYFALVTDFPDSDHPDDQHDSLMHLAARLIEGLNQRYHPEGRSPFFLFHRRRAYNFTEKRWMGWERKRGKLLDLNRLLRGDDDAFRTKVGDLTVLAYVRYVITLDSDTQLPRDSAARLIGAIAHPLNQAVVDPARRIVTDGYGILQPRIGISVHSASRSRLAALYSGQTGFDIYTRAISDVYQDLFGEGIFTGKGIYEVDTLRCVIEQRFPENALLSHDLIEGTYARTALVSDIELFDDYPSHFSAYCRRKHRWVRGDWQILRWIRSRVPDLFGRLIPNPLPLISRWKIVDNLRRSLLEPAMVLLLLSAWLWLPGRSEYWTAATILIWCLPVLSALCFAFLRVPSNRRALPAWIRDTAYTFRENALLTMCSFIFLLHQALISADAILRAVTRVFVTGKKILEWETAAEAEASSRSKATVDVYLEWTPWITLGIAAMILIIRPEALPSAAPLLFLWLISRPFSNWLNRRPCAGQTPLGKQETQLLRESADRVWRFFHEWSNSSTNWLIPDSVREDGAADLRLSPTNLGMLLNARIAAVHLGLMPLAEFVFDTRQTLDQVVRLPKYRGHLLNWYDLKTLEPVRPGFVSSVDSGNLAAALWALKQAALAFASESAVKRGLTQELAAELRALAEQADRLVCEMDFRFLYRPRQKTLSIGYDVDSGRLELASYDLLASEARTAIFVAIAKGDIPQDCWFKLGRSRTLVRGDRVLLSWSGTMFEYLMPALWMRHFPDTILDQAMKGAVRCQREFGRRRGVPWGISECAFLSKGEADGYGYRAFGLPELAMKTEDPNKLVISPYATFLAASVDPAAAAENLSFMEKFGWLGRYGFYEAIDYTQAGGEAVRKWMAHHQGMSLLSIVNVLFDNPLRRYFHAEPQVRATELLLHERLSPARGELDLKGLPELQPVAA